MLSMTKLAALVSIRFPEPSTYVFNKIILILIKRRLKKNIKCYMEAVSIRLILIEYYINRSINEEWKPKQI